MHQPIGGKFSKDFKSLKRIEIFWLVQVLLNFERFLGSPLGGGRWVDGVGLVWVCRECPIHTHMHTHAHIHTHTHTCMLNMINMINMDASMLAAICNFYTCIYMHVYACTCMCMCMVIPSMPPDAPRHPPPTCPFLRATGSWKHQNSISLELIEIFQFCLKILYLWSFLKSYRL